MMKHNIWGFKIIRKDKPSLVGEGLLNFLKLQKNNPRFWQEIDKVVFFHEGSKTQVVITSFPFSLVRKNVILLGTTPNQKFRGYFYYEIHLNNGRMFQLRYDGQVREIAEKDKIWTPEVR